MIRDEYVDAAIRVLGVCQSRDPYFPVGGDGLVAGWAEAFQESGLSPEDLEQGVRHAYREAAENFRPLPSTIIQHAKAAYRDALATLPDERRAVMEEANHALQAMGFTPPQAHRLSRQMALGRETELPAERKAELRRRLERRRELPARDMSTVIAFPRPV